jgi:hypothetical protein
VKQNVFANRNRASPTICVRATKSGGRKPPVVTIQRECTGDPHTHPRRSPEQARLRLRRRASHAHGGLTSAPHVSARDECLRPCAVSVLQARYPRPRRADARRSFSACVCASQKSFFRRQAFVHQHKSGGRQPPVATLHASTTTENHAKPALVQESALCGAAQRECTGDPHTHPRRSGVTQWKRPCKCDTHTHGGLTIAAPGCVFARR